MIIFIFCLLLFMVYKAELAPIHLFHKDYLSHKNTTLINGVFVILVYLSHSSAQCNLNHALDIPYISVISVIFKYPPDPTNISLPFCINTISIKTGTNSCNPSVD